MHDAPILASSGVLRGPAPTLLTPTSQYPTQPHPETGSSSFSSSGGPAVVAPPPAWQGKAPVGAPREKPRTCRDGERRSSASGSAEEALSAFGEPVPPRRRLAAASPPSWRLSKAGASRRKPSLF